jgi:hypothetical protein
MCLRHTYRDRISVCNVPGWIDRFTPKQAYLHMLATFSRKCTQIHTQTVRGNVRVTYPSNEFFLST